MTLILIINQKMQSQKIKEFNEKLLENNIDIRIVDYVKTLNDQIYNIDISFVDDFINLVDKVVLRSTGTCWSVVLKFRS